MATTTRRWVGGNRETITIVGLDEVRQNLYNTANFLDSNQIQEVLWTMGRVIRDYCRSMCEQVVYNTLPSPNYTRTGYLKEAIYITTRTMNDRYAAHAAGFAAAQRTYPNRASNARTYRMVPFVPVNDRRAVRVTSGAIYSDVVEYGSDRMAARPFMRAGSDMGERAAVRAGEHAIRMFLRDLNNGRNRLPNGRYAAE